MRNTISNTQTEVLPKTSVRLHYLDWLRVLAILGVFLFHAVHPFDMFPWEIKNAEQSVVVTLFIVFLGPWGMPLFFLLSGAGTWFALRRRTIGQYVRERISRLLIPFIIGSLLLSPIQLYFQWRHQTDTGVFVGSLLEFLRIREISFGPRVFGWAGYHLWFLGFLFAYALIALPLFQWFETDSGSRTVGGIAQSCARRGGLLAFLIPLVLIQLILRPFFPAEHDWADFIFMLAFFVIGYLLYADERFVQAIQRDWGIMLILGILTTLFFFGAGAFDVATEWMEGAGTPGFFLLWAMWGVNSWCWTIFMMAVGIRFLNYTNRWLQYGQEMIMPFFLFHQPVIIVIAFYIVQLDLNLLMKLIIVVLGSFVISVGLYELVFKRIGILRGLLGVKQAT